MTKPVIYKALFGNYDLLPKEPSKELQEYFRFILITSSEVEIKGWEVKYFDLKNNILSNRKAKFSPWDFFDSDNSFYIDGHVSLGKNFFSLAKELLNSNESFAVLRHRNGGNIADELYRCLDNGKINRNEFKRFLAMKPDLSKASVECGFIYRNHKILKKDTQSEVWWNLFCDEVMRDQLLVHHSFKNTNNEIFVIDSFFNSSDDFLVVGVHKNARIKNFFKRFKKAFRIIRTGYSLR